MQNGGMSYHANVCGDGSIIYIYIYIYIQAAKEKALGLNVSIVIDSTPQGVAKSQLGFVNFIAMVSRLMIKWIDFRIF